MEGYIFMDQLLYQKSTPLIRELERYIFLLYEVVN